MMTLDERVARLETMAGDAARALRWQPAQLIASMTSTVTLTESDLHQPLIINCTSASDLIIPDLTEGYAVVTTIVNIGSATITLKDSGGGTIGTLVAGANKTLASAAGYSASFA